MGLVRAVFSGSAVDPYLFGSFYYFFKLLEFSDEYHKEAKFLLTMLIAWIDP